MAWSHYPLPKKSWKCSTCAPKREPFFQSYRASGQGVCSVPYVCSRMQMGQCKPRMFCYSCRSFWALHLKGQFACLSKTVVHSLDLLIAQQFLSIWWTLIVCSSNLSNILTQSVKCLLREMLISLALVASACQPLFLNYAIEKSSNLWPHFRYQFWTQFWIQFRVQLWHLLLFFPYRVPNWASKLVPKIGPQNGSKISSQNLATNLTFFNCTLQESRLPSPPKQEKPTFHTAGFFLRILWNV